jgi:hypothetical protein
MCSDIRTRACGQCRSHTAHGRVPARLDGLP